MESTKVYEQAVLSEAADADFSNITNLQTFTKALTNIRFSETQATEFVSKWRVIDHQPNTPTGFSATLFERIDN